MNKDTVSIGHIIQSEPTLMSYDTIGWKVIASATVLLCLFTLILFLVKYQRRKYIRQALASINEVKNLPSNEHIRKINHIMRQVAVSSQKDYDLSALPDKDWVKHIFSRKTSKHLSKERYLEILSYIYKSKDEQVNKETYDEYWQFAKYWIRANAL